MEKSKEAIDRHNPMVRSQVHGINVPMFSRGKCGEIGIWDFPSEMGYRCEACGAMFGSITSCKESQN